MSPQPKSEYEVYKGASDLVSTRWTQGQFSDGWNYCLVGAVGKMRGLGLYSISLSKSDIKAIEKRLYRRPSYLVIRSVPAIPLVVIGVLGTLKVLTGLALELSLGAATGILALAQTRPLRQAYIEMWNDYGTRTKQDVVKLLAEVAQEFRPDWLEDEVLRLSIECSSLRQEIALLKEKLALAEAENQRLWRRILGVKDGLEADKQQLAQLEEELSAKMTLMEQRETVRS